MTPSLADLSPPPKPSLPLEIYQLHLLLLEISPARWRRLLVRSDSSIFDLHYFIQMAFGWSDTHLHQFKLHGKTYGVYHRGGVWFDDDPKLVHLKDLKLRLKERFLYQYDFGDNWRVQIRLEQKRPFNPKTTYPVCTGGANLVPPEDCGGPAAFVQIETELKLALWEKERRFLELMSQILPSVMAGEGRKLVEPHRAELEELLHQLKAARFDRQALNLRLQQYLTGDPAWLEGFGV